MFQTGAAVEYLRRQEGVVPHMYLDGVGLVTVGVGFCLPNPATALALGFVRRDNGAAATDEEKRTDWESVHSRPKAEPPASYRAFTHLGMPDTAIDRELSLRIHGFTRNLRSRFPRFDGFPDAAQIGLLDMIYNLGPGGLFRGFPKFCAAVDREDWTACAREGVRAGVSRARNEGLTELFVAAGRGKD
jgi:GH24 family phage-related lysozyme (muramidase)